MSESKAMTFSQLRVKYDYELDSFQNYNYYNLWHYTNADGLMGIVKNKPDEHGKLHFWFTRSDCLNDPSEGTHILNLFHQTFEKLKKENKIDDTFFDLMYKIDIPKDHIIRYPLPLDGDEPDGDCVISTMTDIAECDAFICSFSLKEDSLDMWRYYSKGNGGYGLKCLNRLFGSYIEYEDSNFQTDAIFSKIVPIKVIYRDQEKKQYLEELLLDTYRAYNSANAAESNIFLRRETETLAFLQDILQKLQFRFKHECYETEQEYRFVFYRPRKKPQNLMNDLPKVLYRNQNGVLVPYIDLEIEDGNSHLLEVLVSPFIEERNAEYTVKDYLMECGYSCNVRKSMLPVRN